MSDHHIETTIDAPGAEVLSVLRTRPASWLRSFLRLAILGAGGTRGVEVSTPPWYRLGVPESNSSGATVSTLTWWPHADRPDVFDRFKGRLIVSDAGTATRLELDGRANGGLDERNDALLSRLLTLMGGAIAERYGADG
jgi:hypothetical protein